ncbi:hypothetical protein D210916BOD24_34100 [Alteromonas sp. D210916BOD_24]|uniref:GGDEF domain-containing protein n=1 Tax=Alteromonas sp. D210916BOD_24 TaxID=3157618 RepID=UPI00399D2A02
MYDQLYNEEMEKVTQLPGAFESYLLPRGKTILFLDIDSQISRPFDLSVSSLSDYQWLTSVHTFTLSMFVGFCLALTLYVGMLGNSMRSYGFYSYSFYVLNAAVFFLLQEGLLNIAFPNAHFFSNFKLHLMFAGITVFAAVSFLDQLLDFAALLRSWQRRIILGTAQLALGLAIIQTVLPMAIGEKVNQLLSLVTLIAMALTFAACVFATYRKVHCADLVILGITIMVFSMLFRLVFKDASPFMYRYGLIIGVTLEAFIFAIATSKKVKKLDDDRLVAFRRASTDALCKVLNRSGWESLAQNLLTTFNKEAGFVTLLFIDIDNFKDINDQYGHSAGDEVLQVVAKILQSRCRDEDAIGRIGGDEFVVMSHCFSEGQSKRLAARIVSSLEHRDIRTENFVIPVSASVGVYITNEKCENLDALLNKADKMMYSVKAEHKSHLI